MSREIKFRAWDGRKMIMPRDKAFYQHFISFCGQIVQSCHEGMHCFGGADIWKRELGLTLMQYTGLKDRNGVEIYEGDVVVFPSRGLMFTALIEQLCPVNGLQLKCEDKWAHMMYSPIWEDSQVEGNIYENPEILEGTA